MPGISGIPDAGATDVPRTVTALGHERAIRSMRERRTRAVLRQNAHRKRDLEERERS
jgi:hypothetical protein